MAFPLQISAWSGVFYLYSPGCISSWRGVTVVVYTVDMTSIGLLYVCIEAQRLITTVEVKHTTEKSYMESKTNCYILSTKNTRKLFSIPLNATNWEFLEAGVSFGKFHLCEGKSCHTSFERSSYPQHFGKISFQ